ncbi:MAG: SDR family oxidoreductase [Oscillospiraceae bacterium]|nr:SDR family oxidoreductase [Oscillospiraceae bacterium]
MDKRVALITGVEGVMGVEIVKHMARKGYAIALACCDDFDKARALERLCAVQGVETLLLSGDINVSGTCSKWIADILTFFQRLDVLICNVGYNSEGQWFNVIDDADFLPGAQNEIHGLVDLIQAAAWPMEQGKQGRMITVSLPCGLVSKSRDELLTSAVEGMTRTKAKELAKHNITVNAVLPGVIDFPNHVVRSDNALLDIPLSRLGKPSEVTEAVDYLLSPAAAYVTGLSLAVDGGVRL